VRARPRSRWRLDHYPQHRCVIIGHRFPAAGSGSPGARARRCRVFATAVRVACADRKLPRTWRRQRARSRRRHALVLQHFAVGTGVLNLATRLPSAQQSGRRSRARVPACGYSRQAPRGPGHVTDRAADSHDGDGSIARSAAIRPPRTGACQATASWCLSWAPVPHGRPQPLPRSRACARGGPGSAPRCRGRCLGEVGVQVRPLTCRARESSLLSTSDPVVEPFHIDVAASSRLERRCR